eukprot:8648206-Lingulodinium_polyedra.AAC.1
MPRGRRSYAFARGPRPPRWASASASRRRPGSGVSASSAMVQMARPVQRALRRGPPSCARPAGASRGSPA